MDGVPGVTQNAVMPGKVFTYEFTASTHGTYWYHSHQEGSKQVVKGLYGSIIIESKNQPKYDLDKVILLDEWSSMGMNMERMDHSNMQPASPAPTTDHGSALGSHGSHGSSQPSTTMFHSDAMNNMYDTMIVNGKAVPEVEKIVVREGAKVKLRFINAGLFTQVPTIPGHSYKVTHFDGQEVNEPTEVSSDIALRIAPAERYDVEFTANHPGAWGISSFAETNKNQVKADIPLVYEGHESKQVVTAAVVDSFLDITNYGKTKELSFGQIIKSYEVDLGMNDGGETYTIHGKKMPNHESFEVKKDDVVKVTIKMRRMWIIRCTCTISSSV